MEQRCGRVKGQLTRKVLKQEKVYTNRKQENRYEMEIKLNIQVR